MHFNQYDAYALAWTQLFPFLLGVTYCQMSCTGKYQINQKTNYTCGRRDKSSIAPYGCPAIWVRNIQAQAYGGKHTAARSHQRRVNSIEFIFQNVAKKVLVSWIYFTPHHCVFLWTRSAHTAHKRDAQIFAISRLAMVEFERYMYIIIQRI